MKYRYALSAAGELIDVMSLKNHTRRSLGKFTCLDCNRTLIPALGKIQAPHFRHKHDGKSICSRETYLHKLAKKLFVSSFLKAKRSGQSFELTLPRQRTCSKWAEKFDVTCLHPPGSVSYDLTKFFDTIEEERKTDGYIADVLLSSSKTGQRLLIEIKITHSCSPEKISSGQRIIEIDIKSEEDMSLFASGLDVRDTRLSAYNLKEPDTESVSCNRNCGTNTEAFHVYQSGKVFMQRDHPSNVEKVMARPSTIYTRLTNQQTDDGLNGPFNETDIHIESLRAFRKGIDVRACTLCRYAAHDTWESAAFCKLQRKGVSNSDAADCSKYRPENREIENHWLASLATEDEDKS